METFSFIIRQTHVSEEFFGVDSISLPTSRGYLEILPGHGDLIAETGPGTCLVKHEGRSESLAVRTSGLFKIKAGRAVLIL